MKDPDAEIPFSELKKDYKTFTGRKPTEKKLGDFLRKKGFRKKRTRKGMVYLGIRLKK